MKSRALFYVVSCITAFSTPSFAGQLSFLNGTIASHIPASDLPAFKTKVAEVLNQVDNNTESTWQSSANARKVPVTVAFTPLSTVQTASAQTCRLLSAQVSQPSASESWQFWFCKQADGAWKASSVAQ